MNIYYDGHCQICQRFAAFIRKVDFAKQIHLISFRSLDHYPQTMEAEIHVYTNNKCYTGFNAIIAITKKLPLFWIFLPILTVLKWLRLGDLVYTKVAQARNHLFKATCTDNCFIKTD